MNKSGAEEKPVCSAVAQVLEQWNVFPLKAGRHTPCMQTRLFYGLHTGSKGIILSDLVETRL